MISEQQIDLAGDMTARVTYHVAGEGTPIVLLHGWGASWYLWHDTMLALAGAGYRAIAPDHIGCGQSSKPLLCYTPRDYARYLDSFVDAPGLERFTLVGHSLGGHIALSYAIRHPQRVTRLALVGPAFSPLRQITATRAELLLALAGLPLIGELSLALAPAALLAWVFRQPWGGFYQTPHLQRQFLRRMADDYARASPLVCNSVRSLAIGALPGAGRLGCGTDLLPDAGRAAMPALLVWGEHDALLRPAAYRLLASRLPNATALALANAGHTPPMEAPQEWLAALIEFLRR